MELRISVEVEAAGLAAARHNKMDLARIVRINRAFAKAMDDGDMAIDADFEFHAAIGAATHNPYFGSFLNFIGRLIIPRRGVHLETTDRAGLERILRRIDREHRAITEAIAGRNVTAARRVMRTHLIRSRDQYASLIGKDPG
jgi:DNA-binding FadR family transcriptional regulator